ncbi:hypothetical protein JW898_01850, partial [Candidatus Woesearchaeota archaeon]|nr:hypothetical protein [Candidatus Woesearchaeota archaeon]
MYEFLLADLPETGGCKEGDVVEGEVFYGNACEMEARLRALFRDPKVVGCVSSARYPVWEVDGAEVFFLSRRHSVLPGNP